MASVKERLSARVERLREKSPLVDHVVLAVRHYGDRNGNDQAGAVTFFGFLSFFPILALAFFVVGFVSGVYPELRNDLIEAIGQVLPGLVGTGEGQIPLSTFEDRAGTVGWIGLAGVVYSGLNWVSGMRRALEVMFVLPEQSQPGLVVGKGRDLLALGVLGAVLVLSVSLSGAVAWFSELILDVLGLAESWLAVGVLWALGHALAIAATTLLFVAMFRMLARPRLASPALWHGALVGAVGFEVLKGVANFLIGETKEQPAFQAFGVALILLVWINYFSRLVMLSASWAYTSPVAEEVRALERTPLVAEGELDAVVPPPTTVVDEDPGAEPAWVVRERTRKLRETGGAVAAGAAAGGAAVALLTRLRRRLRR